VVIFHDRIVFVPHASFHRVLFGSGGKPDYVAFLFCVPVFYAIHFFVISSPDVITNIIIEYLLREWNGMEWNGMESNRIESNA